MSRPELLSQANSTVDKLNVEVKWREQLERENTELREKLAAWMLANSYATGHGDSVEDLLKELDWQHAERMARPTEDTK